MGGIIQGAVGFGAQYLLFGGSLVSIHSLPRWMKVAIQTGCGAAFLFGPECSTNSFRHGMQLFNLTMASYMGTESVYRSACPRPIRRAQIASAVIGVSTVLSISLASCYQRVLPAAIAAASLLLGWRLFPENPQIHPRKVCSITLLVLAAQASLYADRSPALLTGALSFALSYFGSRFVYANMGFLLANHERTLL